MVERKDWGRWLTGVERDRVCYIEVKNRARTPEIDIPDLKMHI